MNQQQQPASGVQGTPAATEPVESTRPQARIALHLIVGIGKHGDKVGHSKAELLVWALTAYKDTLYRHLIRAVKEGDDESLIDAGSLLTDLELCDETLTDIAIGLHNVATENAAIIQSLTDAGYKPEDRAHFEQRYADKITKAFTR